MNRSNGPRSGSIPLLPVHGQSPRRRRSDAEHNRARVLEAARRLAAERGFAGVTMDQVAAAAGVGKGTVFRGFGSRSGLAEALLGDAERVLQQGILTGEAPLGPGADPGERLAAFVSAYLRFEEDNVELLLETERTGQGARFHTGAYGFWHVHVTALLEALGHPRAPVLAHVLLATLSADLYRHLRSGIGVHRKTVRATLAYLTSLLANAPEPTDTPQ